MKQNFWALQNRQIIFQKYVTTWILWIMEFVFKIIHKFNLECYFLQICFYICAIAKKRSNECT